MSSKNTGGNQSLMSASDLKSFTWNAFQILYHQFTKLWTPVQVLLAVCGLVLALSYGNELRVSLLNTQHSFAKALEAKLEPTRNTGQGIAAFLLSNVKDEWTNADHLNTYELNSILNNINVKVQEITMRDAPLLDASKSDPSKVVSLSAPMIIDKLNLKVTGTSVPWETAISSMREHSFMVVPAMSLRRNTLNELPLKPNDRPQLEAALNYNPEILFDLHLASEIEPIMRKIDDASGELLKVVQTYFIIESGVFLLHASGVKDHSKYFKDEFQPYMQYIDRPYFWGAVDPKAREKKTPPFDYGTKPYIDLGGNGFVVTFSKKFDLPNQRVGVLCVDAKLPDYITDEIEQHIKSLGAKASDFHWTKDQDNNDKIEPGKEGLLPNEFSWFNVALGGKREARSQVLGNIAIEPVKKQSAQSQYEARRVVRFTVPVKSWDRGQGDKKTQLLWVEFDSDSILETLTKNLLFFTVGIALVIAVTWSLFRDYTVLKREMSNVLEKMSKVMRDASTPFAWLNEKNEFHKVNNSMLSVLGFNNIEDLKQHAPTFRALITGPTQQTYDDVLSKSSANQETGEYEIHIVTKTDKVLHVRAHGERIPYPTLWRRGLPHRFGIFVKVTEPLPTVEPEPATDKPDLPGKLSAHA